jgi:hypothetical protein
MLRGIKMGKDVRMPEPERYDSEIYQQPPYPQPGYIYPPPERKKKSTMVRAILATAAVMISTAVAALLYIMMIGTAPSCACVPTGAFGEVEVLDPTSARVSFREISMDPRPKDLSINLERNGVGEGSYSFVSNDEGELLLTDGTSVGTIIYEDLANNQKVNIGDRLSITGLEPDTVHTIKLYWVPTGDLITSTTFTTTA